MKTLYKGYGALGFSSDEKDELDEIFKDHPKWIKRLNEVYFWLHTTHIPEPGDIGYMNTWPPRE